MRNALPPLNALRSFVEAANARSISKAAEALYVTPGAVSRLVQKLEDYFGTALFVRTPNGLELTEHGKTYLRDIAGPYAALGDATRRMQRRAVGNRLIVTCHPTFAARWLLPRWNNFSRQRPDIEVQIVTTLKELDFYHHDTDLAIVLGPDVDAYTLGPGIVGEKLLELEMFPICSPKLFADMFAGQGEPSEWKVPLDVLKTHTLIHTDPTPHEWQYWLDAYYNASRDPELKAAIKSVDVSHGPVFATADLAILAALEGIGLSTSIGAFVEQDLANGRLMKPFEFSRKATRFYHILCREERYEDENIALYRDWLLREAGIIP
ncbi:Glycine cleavage system transcriptional activator [Marinovum algicola]|uniref:Regulatory helix-turn-helix protein, lysR family n=1 Tax=Marinovum algicola TaxID=42444 RepID=A0A975WEV7_9RHOB|nr:LysR family transcriptional regulator [Marinovum algicola]SEK09083.1 regulatory helix-turn-helix protein, lysR family [Marinovum algicola]SLN71679.1 Glycine cleavage system transcriptional activator [Marinovum algicola]